MSDEVQVASKDDWPEDLCPKTGKRHEPDWTTISVEHDGGDAYVDVNCKDCGRSGCIGKLETLKNDIDW